MDRLFAIFFQTFLLFVSSLINLVSSENTFTLSMSFNCMTSKKNASISYLNNVNNLYSDFASHASESSYYNTSVGDKPNKVYGYYMCRGDITSRDCYDCILNTTRFAIKANCVYDDGISFSEMCMFRYANHSMYGVWQEELIVDVVPTMGSVEGKTRQYNKTLANITEALIDKAASGCHNKKGDEHCVPGFATKEGNVTGDETIYSLAQCTPDIVGVNCSKCLHLAFTDLQSDHGAQVYRPNCQLMYDNTSFYPLPKAIPIVEPSSRTSPDPFPSSISPSPLHSWLSVFVLVFCVFFVIL